MFRQIAFLLVAAAVGLGGCMQCDSGCDISGQTTSVSQADDGNDKMYFEDTAQKLGAGDRGIVAVRQGKIDSSLDGEGFDSLYDDIWTLPDTYLTDGVDILTERDNLTALLIAGGGSLALRKSGADDRIADEMDRTRAFRDEWSDELIYEVGGPGFHFAAAGLWYLWAHGDQDEFNKARAWKLIEALAITGTTTVGLKLIAQDKTPNDKYYGWPSGHTASSFTVAAVLDEYYGPKVGIPAYIGAGVVGYRMMDTGDHWASDVLFGMFLGYIVGHEVAGDGQPLSVGGFDVKPFASSSDQPASGIAFVKKF